MHIDASLVKRCKKYDQNAFLELFRNYEKYLYKLCMSYVQNEQDALDLAQEVYIKVFKNINKFDEKMPFHPWFRKIAVNTCLSFTRTLKHDTISLSAEIDEDRHLEDVIAASEDVEAEVVISDMMEVVKQHLQSLSPKHRMVIILRHFEELSYEEIANVMNQPVGTVKTDLYRARNLLKGKLAQELEV